MKILYLTFYFEPDLCAGSFRNTSLVQSLSDQLGQNDTIDVYTTYPNRYKTYKKAVPNFEEKKNIRINRINVPEHESGIIDQIATFCFFFFTVRKFVRNKNYDLVFASSSRLFTAYLGYSIANKKNIPLYLDIRDIFVDTIGDILKNPFGSLVIFVLRIIEKKTFNHASHINLISEGFLPYFKLFKCSSYSFFSNGIDEEFLDNHMEIKNDNKQMVIMYAGNIGEGQGLEKIIPPAAEMLGDNYKFLIIGGGGKKGKLLSEILKRKLNNVEVQDPVSRNELRDLYNKAQFLFIHLNDYKAFERVLPSKIFELASYDKPIIAGVLGFSYRFIKENVQNVILFKSCNVESFVDQVKKFNYKTLHRGEFINKYQRKFIDYNMSQSIINIINNIY
ncbi:MAG: glycosyltransferase family 4 protein [Bacteroidales bacterium]|nr:glycosyltransferase family 4 protein [Bacteroidales bacterium]